MDENIAEAGAGHGTTREEPPLCRPLVWFARLEGTTHTHSQPNEQTPAADGFGASQRPPHCPFGVGYGEIDSNLLWRIALPLEQPLSHYRIPNLVPPPLPNDI